MGGALTREAVMGVLRHTVDGDYVITAGSVAQSAGHHMFIVAYRLGATGKLPGSAGS
jgi:hypothetical protein